MAQYGTTQAHRRNIALRTHRRNSATQAHTRTDSGANPMPNPANTERVPSDPQILGKRTLRWSWETTEQTTDKKQATLHPRTPARTQNTKTQKKKYPHLFFRHYSTLRSSSLQLTMPTPSPNALPTMCDDRRHNGDVASHWPPQRRRMATHGRGPTSTALPHPARAPRPPVYRPYARDPVPSAQPGPPQAAHTPHTRPMRVPRPPPDVP